MKIGLLSVYNHNYGSILQAYALQTVLRTMGNDTEIIYYKKINMVKQAKRLLYMPLLKATIKMKWKSIYCKAFHKDIYNTVLISREKAFSDFINNHIFFSKIYAGRTALNKGVDEYDCFILGSDQVWNPMNLGGDFYTMTFIPDNKMKITYAPSFGVSQIPKAQVQKTREYLQRIDFISVRETDGVSIVKELTGRDVQQVVDPTILVDRSIWDMNKDERLINQKYIFCYFISTNSDYREFVKKLAKKTGLKIVTLPHVDEYVDADNGFGDIVPEGVGPLQFVNLISNAEYICTDSFHGSVFATLYEKPFFVFNRYSSEALDSTNSRLYSFLKMIGMENRLYKSCHEITESDLQVPNFVEAKQKLDSLRCASILYLENSIKTVKDNNQ